MISLGSKIQQALVGSVLVVGLCAGIILAVNQRSLLASQQTIDTMTMEYRLIGLSNQLATSYNEFVRSSGDPDDLTKYQEVEYEITNTLDTLETQIISSESQNLLMGLKNTITQIMDECNLGITEIGDNNYENSSIHFTNALKISEFAASNTNLLLQKELEYLSSIQQQSQRLNLISISVSGTILVLIIGLILLFSRSVSRQIISPIERLTKSTKIIASGNFDESIDESLLTRPDEVGVLTNSFNQMIANIKAQITKLNSLKDELEANNSKLSKLNEFMVGRELKMVALKKQLKELTSPK